MEKRECSYKFKATLEMAKPELHLKCCIYCGGLGVGSSIIFLQLYRVFFSTLSLPKNLSASQ